MKRIGTVIITMVWDIVFPTILQAFESAPSSDPLERISQRLSMNFTLGIGLVTTESHLKTVSDNKRIVSLSQTPESQAEFRPEISLLLDYDLGNSFGAYLSLPGDEEPRPTAGLRYESSRFGRLNGALFYGLPLQVWEDPYLVGVDRRETDENWYGLALNWAFHDLALGYELSLVDVDRDQIGHRYSALKRDGAIHRFQAGYEIELGRGFSLDPEVEFTLADLKGKSQQFHGAAMELSLVKRWRAFELVVSLEGGGRIHEHAHPIFQKTREDAFYESRVMLSWINPLGYQYFTLNLGGGYGQTDSNIRFYDTHESFSFMSIGYRFGRTRPGQ